MQPGTRLGPYEILSPLGAGGMGEVWRARDTRLERDVAIKIVHPGLAPDPDRLSRFEKEARAAARLDHPNILVVHDVGTHEGSPFIVSELLQGESLREKLGDPLPPRKAVDWAIQIAHGLAAAHEKGIVHRDIKPENVFVTKAGHVKILDFGIAKLLPSFGASGVETETPTATATQPGAAVGTVAYMSPEQIRGQPVDARTDLFSLGVVLYEMLSGRRPFQRETPAETMAAVLREEPADLSETNRSVPAALENVVRHCLEKGADGRFQSARDVVFALEALRDLSTTTERAPMSPAGVWIHRHRRLLTGAAIAVVLLAAGTLLVVRKRSAASRTLPSVLALPCTVYGAPDAAFLADAVPGTISTLLSQVEGIDTKVPPSSFEVEKVKGDLTKLAELYQVSSFVVTSITPSPGRFALNVQLVDAGTRKVRWGRQFEGPRETYNDLARQAAEGIRLAVSPAALPVPTATVSSEAELAFREGAFHLDRYLSLNRPADFEGALAAFTRALELDPSFGTAAGKVAELFAARFDAEGIAADEQTESWARRALSMDPHCGEAWAALSAAELYKTRPDPERGLEYAAKAVAFAPRDAWAHLNLGMWLMNPGSISLSIAAGLRSIELDPFLLPPAGNAAVGLCYLGRPGDGLAVVDRALRVQPDWRFGLSVRGFALTRLGRLEEAESALRRSEPTRATSHTNSELWRQFRLALAVAQRDRATSEALARQIVASALDGRADANLVANATNNVAPLLTRLGRTDDAFRLLEKSVEIGIPPSYDWLLADPDMRPLRGDARFGKVTAASRGGAAMVAGILGQSRSRGELPKYLEKPLDELLKLLDETGAKIR